jgi:hypothetical protein
MMRPRDDFAQARGLVKALPALYFSLRRTEVHHG